MAGQVLGQLRKIAGGLYHRLPLILLAFAFAVVIFIYGYLVGVSHIFPFRQMKFAYAAFRALGAAVEEPANDLGVSQLSRVPLRAMARARVTPLSADRPAENLLMPLALHQLRGVCPDDRCLAAEFSRDGKVLRTVPYRESELEKALLSDLPHEQSPFGDGALPTPLGLEQLPGGDMIVTFGMRNGYPFGGGVARVRPDGRFVWYRRDYTHHWANIIGPDEIALTTTEIRDGGFEVRMSARSSFSMVCPTHQHYADIVRVIDFNGKILEEFSALDTLVASPARGVLASTNDPCDPTHLNYATIVGPEIAASIPGVSPKDFLLSFYGVSAIAIVSRETHRLLHLYHGPFIHQHAVQPEHGSKVIMFDNNGSDGREQPSRLLEYDLVTAEARTIFPAAGSAEHPYSEVQGTIAFSADRQRVLVCFSMDGICYEVRLLDGKPLMKFDNLGNASDVGVLGPDRFRYAAHFLVNSLYYAQ